MVRAYAVLIRLPSDDYLISRAEVDPEKNDLVERGYFASRSHQLKILL